MYKKLKKQNGEKFAQTLRDYHNGLLEIEGIDTIVRHAGRDAEPLLPYLMGLLAAISNAKQSSKPGNPFALLDQAGYNAFYADTLDAQNCIASYFKPDEMLCTFNDAARYKNYHIVHAVKKDVGLIRRENFYGREQRQDIYGTSIISIQMLKSGGFISIKNRYNQKVSGCDNTFNSNPDNIIDGLSASLKDYFNVDFTVKDSPLPDGFVLIGQQILKYHTERNNIYYGDNVWVENGVVHVVNRSIGDALFGEFLFDNKTKTLQKIDPNLTDDFAEDFNRFLGGNNSIHVQKGNLILNDDILISAQNCCITGVDLTAFSEDGVFTCFSAFLKNPISTSHISEFHAPPAL